MRCFTFVCVASILKFGVCFTHNTSQPVRATFQSWCGRTGHRNGFTLRKFCWRDCQAPHGAPEARSHPSTACESSSCRPRMTSSDRKQFCWHLAHTERPLCRTCRLTFGPMLTWGFKTSQTQNWGKPGIHLEEKLGAVLCSEKVDTITELCHSFPRVLRSWSFWETEKSFLKQLLFNWSIGDIRCYVSFRCEACWSDDLRHYAVLATRWVVTICHRTKLLHYHSLYSQGCTFQPHDLLILYLHVCTS